MRVLLVDADTPAADRLSADLSRQGYAVEVLASGAQLLAAPPEADVVLLGLDLPDLDGLEVCRRLRERWEVPIIALSSRDTEMDRVLGFQAGLDDYVARPLRLRELAARIDAVMRRVRPSPPMRGSIPEQSRGPDVLGRGALRIHVRTREVRMSGRLVPVTRKEFDLLALLASEPGRVFSRGRIMAKVWHDESALPSRTIDTHVGTLRAKLGSRKWIVTVHGVGFRLGEA